MKRPMVEAYSWAEWAEQMNQMYGAFGAFAVLEEMELTYQPGELLAPGHLPRS
jgi:hypothetical protein